MAAFEQLTEYLWSITWLSLLLAWLLMGFKWIPHGSHYTVECCGRHLRTLKPGLHLVLPFIERIAKRVSVKQELLQLPMQQVTLSTGDVLQVSGLLAFQVVHAGKAAYRVKNVAEALLNLAVVSMRITASNVDLANGAEQADVYNQALQTRINSFVQTWGINILWVESELVLTQQGNEIQSGT